MAGERFDAFISYSRAASSQLASDLQVGIERFGKPWYRLRASRVFRDDSSMSANTALWGTIEAGLREAGHVILLATPEAAASEYVNNEVAWWVKHKGAGTILLVHAGGEISWDRTTNTFSADTSAVPPALLGAYAEEPRWIDMRWYSEPGGLGKADARFTERVADLAAAVRNVERDVLVGENVKQHRRALTLLRGGITALAALLVVSLVATVIAVAQGAEAAVQRDAAQRQARVATARQLSATALSLMATDATTAKLLAVYGYQLNADPQTQAALLAAVSTASGDASVSVDVGEPVTAVAGSTDGSTVILGTDTGRVLSWTPGGAAPTELGNLGASVITISTSDDGTVVAADAQEYVSNDRIDTMGLWVDGTQVALPDEAIAPLQVSPSGDTVGFGMPLPANYESKAFLGDSGFAFVRRADDYATVSATSIFTPGVAQVVLPDDDTVTAWLDSSLENGQVQRRTLDDFSIVTDAMTPGGVPRDHPGQLSPSGDYIVQVDRNHTWDVDTDIPIYATDADTDEPTLFGYAPNTAIEALAFSPDGTRFASAATGVIYVSTPRAPGEPAVDPLVLTGNQSITAMTFLNAGTLVSASGTAAVIRRLDAGNPLQTDVPFDAATMESAGHDMPLRLSLNENGTQLVTLEQGFPPGSGLDRAEGTSTWRTVGENDPATVQGVPLAWRSGTEAFLLTVDGIQLYDTETATSTPLAEAPALDGPSPSDTTITADSARYIAASNRLIVATPSAVVALDGTTGKQVESWDYPSARLSPDARFVVTSEESGGGYTSTVTELATGAQTVIPGAGIEAAGYRGPYVAQITDRQTAALWSTTGADSIGSFPNTYLGPLVVSDDGALAASYTIDGFVSVLSVLTGQVLGRFDIHGVYYQHSGAAFSGDGKVLIGAHTDSPQGGYAIIDLDPTHWVQTLCASVGRDFTDAEWKRYTGQAQPDGLGCSTAAAG